MVILYNAFLYCISRTEYYILQSCGTFKTDGTDTLVQVKNLASLSVKKKIIQENLSVAAYVLQMRDQLEWLSVLTRENMEKAQKCQKTWYDKSSRTRSLEPGQQVLLLLPSQESKLMAKWKGPYQVIRKMGPLTYEISMPKRQKTKQVFHINMLK